MENLWDALRSGWIQVAPQLKSVEGFPCYGRPMAIMSFNLLCHAKITTVSTAKGQAPSGQGPGSVGGGPADYNITIRNT
jgi:hypothetical protein